MTPVQQLVLVMGLLLIGLTLAENWRPEVESLI